MYGTDVFLAGGEVDLLTNALVDNGARWILFSYFYLWDFEAIPRIHATMDAHPEIEFTLDSGAYTYAMQYELKKGTANELPGPEEYVRRYFDYLDEHGWRWARVAEPDLEWVSGLGVDEADVDRWREEMLSSWPTYDIMPVYHSGRGEVAWRRYCKDERVRSLAMGSGFAGGKSIGAVRRMTMYAQTRGKGVHGFGCTKLKTVLRYVPFDWVDSTSVWAGQQYGTMYVFNPKGAHGTFHVLRERNERRKFRAYFRDIGCDPDLIFADTGPGAPTEVIAEIRKANVIAWARLGERMHLLKLRRDHVYPSLFANKGKPEARVRPSDLQDRDDILVRLDRSGLPDKSPALVRLPVQEAYNGPRARTGAEPPFRAPAARWSKAGEEFGGQEAPGPKVRTGEEGSRTAKPRVLGQLFGAARRETR